MWYLERIRSCWHPHQAVFGPHNALSHWLGSLAVLILTSVMTPCESGASALKTAWLTSTCFPTQPAHVSTTRQLTHLAPLQSCKKLKHSGLFNHPSRVSAHTYELSVGCQTACAQQLGLSSPLPLYQVNLTLSADPLPLTESTRSWMLVLAITLGDWVSLRGVNSSEYVASELPESARFERESEAPLA